MEKELLFVIVVGGGMIGFMRYAYKNIQADIIKKTEQLAKSTDEKIVKYDASQEAHRAKLSSIAYEMKIIKDAVGDLINRTQKITEKNKDKVVKKRGNAEKEIFAYLTGKVCCSATEISKATSYTKPTVIRVIDKLVADGVLEKVYENGKLMAKPIIK